MTQVVVIYKPLQSDCVLSTSTLTRQTKVMPVIPFICSNVRHLYLPYIPGAYFLTNLSANTKPVTPFIDFNVRRLCCPIIWTFMSSLSA